jgi:hypothetical protein
MSTRRASMLLSAKDRAELCRILDLLEAHLEKLDEKDARCVMQIPRAPVSVVRRPK